MQLSTSQEIIASHSLVNLYSLFFTCEIQYLEVRTICISIQGLQFANFNIAPFKPNLSQFLSVASDIWYKSLPNNVFCILSREELGNSLQQFDNEVFLLVRPSRSSLRKDHSSAEESYAQTKPIQYNEEMMFGLCFSGTSGHYSSSCTISSFRGERFDCLKSS